MKDQPDTGVATRRAVVVGAGASGLAVVLGACSTYGKDTAEGTQPAATSAPQSPPADTGGAGQALAKTSDIPVGGGKIFETAKVVVTQPQQGQFKAFSAVCQHQGCTVGSVSGGTINCPCHGSKYKVADGSVSLGPTTKGLPERAIKVQGDEITLG